MYVHETTYYRIEPAGLKLDRYLTDIHQTTALGRDASEIWNLSILNSNTYAVSQLFNNSKSLITQ